MCAASSYHSLEAYNIVSFRVVCAQERHNRKYKYTINAPNVETRSAATSMHECFRAQWSIGGRQHSQDTTKVKYRIPFILVRVLEYCDDYTVYSNEDANNQHDDHVMDKRSNGSSQCGDDSLIVFFFFSGFLYSIALRFRQFDQNHRPAVQ